MDVVTTSTPQACEIPSSDVTILEGHTSEVLSSLLHFSTLSFYFSFFGGLSSYIFL